MSKTAHEIAAILTDGDQGRFAEYIAQAWFVADKTDKEIIEQSFAHVFRKVDSKFLTREAWVLVRRSFSDWDVVVLSTEALAQGRFDWELKDRRGLNLLGLAHVHIPKEHVMEYVNTLYRALCDTENGFETFAMAAERVWRKDDVQAKA